jgi:hypothetical protein
LGDVGRSEFGRGEKSEKGMQVEYIKNILYLEDFMEFCY